MNRELVVAFLRQRLASPMRLVIFSLLFGFPIVIALAMRGASYELVGSNAPNFGLLLAAGLIGQDVSAGVLQLVFARPVSRAQYVFSRWGAAAIAAAGVMILQVALFWAVAALRGAARDPGEMALFALEVALHAVGIVSVITLFSSLVAGLGDLALYVLAGFTAGVLGMIGQAVPAVAFLARVGREIDRFVGPQIALSPLLQGGGVSWVAVVTYLSTVSLCLALAIAAVNRKELSYASNAA